MGCLESGTYVQVIETGRIGEVLSREAQLADMLDVSVNTIQNWERGRNT